MSQITKFNSLDELVAFLRGKLDEKKYVLLFAYNGTGKTRLSMNFKDLGKVDGGADTLYFNAFTEDLFSWDNDLDNDTQRIFKINQDSRFFEGLQELEMENRIRPLLQRYVDFDFIIDYNEWTINFTREDNSVSPSSKIENIKVSRGEENIFVWCFFLAIAQLAIDAKEEGEAYSWVRYLYIDDPISSLDDNNAIGVASHLSQLLKQRNHNIKVVISTHHTLFFNVMWNELNEKRKLYPYFLNSNADGNGYSLRYTNDTPFFHHVALLKQLHDAVESDDLYTYHFNILRNILEKTATFHGFKSFSACMKKGADDPDGIVHARMINVLSHGNYSLFEPTEMLPENKEYFKNILSRFMQNYRFDPQLFPPQTESTIGNSERVTQS